MGRRAAGQGEIALFDNKEEVEEWVASSDDIDAELWNINSIKFRI